MQGFSTATPNALNYINSITQPKFATKIENGSYVFKDGTTGGKTNFTKYTPKIEGKISEIVKKTTPTLNFGAGVSQAGVTNVNQYNPETKTTESIFNKPTQEKPGIFDKISSAVVPTANAGVNDGLTDGLTDEELQTLINEGYSDEEIMKLNDNLLKETPNEEQPGMFDKLGETKLGQIGKSVLDTPLGKFGAGLLDKTTDYIPGIKEAKGIVSGEDKIGAISLAYSPEVASDIASFAPWAVGVITGNEQAKKIAEEIKQSGKYIKKGLQTALNVDEEATLTKMTEAGIDIGLLFTPTGQASIVSKVPSLSEKIPGLVNTLNTLQKSSPKVYNTVKNILTSAGKGAEEMAKYGIVTEGEIKPENVAIGGVIGGALPVIGGLVKKSGEALYKTAIKPDVNEAELLLRSRAGLGKTPKTRADTALQYGIAGTEADLGIQGLKKADKIFKDTIGPALDKSKITHNIDDLFKKVEDKIINEGKGELRTKELLEGLDALKDDYSTLSKNFTTKSLQAEKTSLDEFTPTKVFKGKEIANGYNQVKNTFANVIREQVRDDLGKLGVPNAKELYRDYANLVELSKIGIKGLTEGGMKGGFGTFWSTLYDKLATPIKTVGGQVLYRTPEGLEFKGPEGIKTVGDFLKQAGLRITNGIITKINE